MPDVIGMDGRTEPFPLTTPHTFVVTPSKKNRNNELLRRISEAYLLGQGPFFGIRATIIAPVAVQSRRTKSALQP
jgi:hypothetical protein